MHAGVLFLLAILLVIAFTLIGIFIFGGRNAFKKWVAIGTGDVTLAVSNDGQEWTQIDGLFGDETIGIATSIARSGNRWVVVGEDGDQEGANIWWSNDAVYWSPATNNDDEDDIFFGTTSGSGGSKVVYADGLFVAGGNSDSDNLYWSEDGKEWNLVDGRDVFLGGTVNDIKFEDDIWVAVGGADDSNRVLYYSEDGTEWTAGSSSIMGGSGGHGDTLEYYNGLWVLGGQNEGGGEFLWWSNDGVSWNKITTTNWGSDGAVNKIKYANGLWVAVGQHDGVVGEAISYSTTGKTWSTITNTDTQGYNLTDVIYNDGEWITTGNKVGNIPVILTSSDGRNWSEVSEDDFTGVNTLDMNVVSGNEKIVLAGGATSSGSDSLWFSTDNGDEWFEPEENPFGAESEIRDIIYA